MQNDTRKTALQIFEENEKKECCRTCGKLVEKDGVSQKIYFCGYCGKIILPMFLDGGKMGECKYERKCDL